jgi:hypothetical protein
MANFHCFSIQNLYEEGIAIDWEPVHLSTSINVFDAELVGVHDDMQRSHLLDASASHRL